MITRDLLVKLMLDESLPFLEAVNDGLKERVEETLAVVTEAVGESILEGNALNKAKKNAALAKITYTSDVNERDKARRKMKNWVRPITASANRRKLFAAEKE